MAFPQPLAPITTYRVSKNPSQQQSFNTNRNLQAKEIGNALAQVFQQQFMQEGSLSGVPLPPTQQLLPQSPQVEFGSAPTTPVPTTTVTTTVAPSTTQAAQPILQTYGTRSGFDGGYQRQLPLHQAYKSGNFGGFPQYYNEPYSTPFNPYQYSERVGGGQMSGRLFGGEPAYQQYDPMTYQFIPTSITPLPTPQNNIKFVPCMCPVAVQVSPPLPEKRTDEIPLLNPTTESENLSQAIQSASTHEHEDERK